MVRTGLVAVFAMAVTCVRLASSCPAAAAMMAQFRRGPTRTTVLALPPSTEHHASDLTTPHECAAVGRSRKRVREEAIDVTPPRNQKLSSPSSSPSDRSRTPRVQPKMSAKVAIGNAAITHRDSVSAARGWLGAFVFTRWGCGHCHPDYDRMLRMVR